MSNFITYIDALLVLMRQANEKARAASLAWNAANDSLDEWMDRHGIMDTKQRADVKSVNLDLQGKYARWSFWEREANRLSATILAEEAAAKLKGAFGEHDPKTTSTTRVDAVRDPLHHTGAGRIPRQRPTDRRNEGVVPRAL